MARQGDNSYLVLTDTDKDNSGIYMASASNQHGESKSYGRLTVSESTTVNGVTTSNSSTVEKQSNSSGSPKKGGQSPNFKKLFYDRHVQNGEAVRIDAIITGSPKPRIKWFFNNDVPLENTRCIMAGDTYSFIIDCFEEKNCGRYTIQAENNYGKASCSAECLFEGSEFMNVPESSQEIGNIITEETFSKDGQTVGQSTTSFSQSSSVKTESKGIETMPVQTRDLAMQSLMPQMKDMSSQMQTMTKDHGIQINPELRDRSSQLDRISTDQMTSFNNDSNNFGQSFNTSSHTESKSYSYSTNVVESSSNTGGGTRLRIDSKDPNSCITIRATPERKTSIDYSTTLIKDINQNRNSGQFEPVELIVSNSNSNLHRSASPYVEQAFEPVNLIVHKPTCGMGRSGSLPPIKNRVNYKQQHHQYNETDEEITHGYAQESKMSYYRDLERRSQQRPSQFKPVELVIDASTIDNNQHNHHYDRAEPCVHKTHVSHHHGHHHHQQHHGGHHHHGHHASHHHHAGHHHVHQQQQQLHRSSVSSIDERYNHGMEINVDVKTPPSIDVPLRSANAPEGQAVKLECVVSGGQKVKSPSPRSQSDSPVRKPSFYQTKPSTMTFNPNNQVSYQQCIESYSSHKPVNYFSQTEVKPFQNNVQMMPSVQPAPRPQSSVHQIQTAVKPQIVRHLQNQTVQLGNRALMQCVIKGSPDTDVKWYHNGNQINLSSQSPRFPITFDKFTGLSSLSIIGANPDDAGQYTCVASNPAGTETSTAWVIVKEPSMERPVPQQQEPQQPFKINRSVSRPKETTPLRFGQIESAKVMEPSRVPQQKPVEIVRAYQKYPEPVVQHVEPMKLNPAEMTRPRIIEPLRNSEFVEGGQAMFECRVEGDPLSVQWFKGPRELFNQFRYRMSHDPQTGICRLAIGTVLEDDAGEYTCRISNPIGEDHTTAALIPAVKQPVEFWNKKPQPPMEAPAPPKPAVIKKPTPLMDELNQRQRERRDNSRRPPSVSDRAPSTGNYPDDVFDSKPSDPFQPIPAKIIKGLKNEQFKENETIVLKALIAGNPHPRASWYKNNMPLIMSQRHSCHNDEGKKICGIKIKNATPDDSGVYSLVIENPYGADDSTCQVMVMPPEPRQRHMSVDSVPYSPVTVDKQPYMAQLSGPSRMEEGSTNPIPPKFVIGLPPNSKLNEGEPIVLTCQVEGSPAPTVTWLKDGNPLPQSLRFNTEYSPETGVATLTVHGTLSNDCGNYTAVAENPAGKAYTTSQAVIKQPHRYDSQDDSQSDNEVPLNRAKPPKVIHGLRDIKEIEGNPVSMACKIDGFPKPTLTWLKNGVPLNASNRFNTTYDLNTGVARLKINDSVLSDAGVYSVIAENKAGSDQTNGRLEIIKDSNIDDKPIVNPQAFQYVQQPPQAPPMEGFGPGQLRRAPSPSPNQRGRRGPSPMGAVPASPRLKSLEPVPDSVYVPNDDENRPLSPPKVIVPLKDLKVKEGMPVNLMTKIIGYPIPSIKWLHNNRPINESSRFTTNYDHTTGIASFKINGTQSNDVGIYTAIADNPAGTCDTTCKLALTPVSLIDTNPIVNPNAFRYLEKPTQERPKDEDVPVSAIKPPKFIVPLSNIVVNQGDHADLLCKLEGYPFPTLTWFKDNKPLPASNRLITNHNLNSGLVYLKINDAQMGDAGYYTCIAENKAGQDQTFCTIKITEQPGVDTTPMVNPDAFRYLEHNPSDRNPINDGEPNRPPKVIIPLENVKLEEGQNVQLACKIEGSPRPKLTWFKDGEPLPAASRFTPNYDYYTNIATLKIDTATPNDVGTYVVLAENVAGKDQTFCQIFVDEIPNIDERPLVNPDAFKYLEKPLQGQPQTDDEVDSPEPPKVIIPLKDMLLKEGEPVLLICKIDGKPKPKLNWYRNMEPLPASSRYETDYNLTNGIATLKIKNSLKNDIGDYLVHAENPYGQDQTSCKLLLNLVPDVDENSMIHPDAFKNLERVPDNKISPVVDKGKILMPPRVIIPLANVRIKEGEDFCLSCKIDGLPKPKLQWFKNGEPLPAAGRFNNNYDLNTCIATLKVADARPEDIGTYTLVGENEVGTDQTSAETFVLNTVNIDETPLVDPRSFFNLEKVPEDFKHPDTVDDLKGKPARFVVHLPSELKLFDTENVELNCKVEGFPLPTLVWYKDNEPLMASNRFTTNYEPVSGNINVKVNFLKANDAGLYVCKAENPYGSDETFTQIQILDSSNVDTNPQTGNPEAFRAFDKPYESGPDKDPINFQPPVVIIPLHDTLVTEEKPVTISCKIIGNPKPKVFQLCVTVALKRF